MMKTAHIQTIIQPTAASDVPMQPASLEIWEQKYRLQTKDGRAIDETIDGTLQRVARALADVETTPGQREHWYEKFLWALRHGAIPAGRPLRPEMLRQPMAVLSGQTVKVVGTGTGFQVTNEGRAMGNAAVGQVAQVRLNSGQVVSGIVRADGAIEIRF